MRGQQRLGSFLVFWSITASISQPLAGEEGCSDGLARVFFANGVANTNRAAMESKKRLDAVIKEVSERAGTEISGMIASPSKEDVLYNTNEPLLLQLLQVVEQKEADSISSFIQFLARIDQAPAWFSDLLLKNLKGLNESHYVIDSDLKKQVEKVKGSIEKGEDILIVSHSQGNFYANSVYRIITKEPTNTKSLQSIAVASPATSVASGGPHTTLRSDGVINFIRSLDAFVLPANVSNSNPGWLDHEFVHHYLGGKESRKKIEDDILNAFKLFPRKEKTSWIFPPDIAEMGFVHESMLPMRKWTINHFNKPRKLSDSECVAVAAFGKIFDWFGEPCSGRSFSALSKWMDNCSKEEWSTPNRRFLVDCPIAGNHGTYSSDRVQMDLVNSNPECKWPLKELPSRISPALIDAAKNFLLRPK